MTYLLFGRIYVSSLPLAELAAKKWGPSDDRVVRQLHSCHGPRLRGLGGVIKILGETLNQSDYPFIYVPNYVRAESAAGS